MILSKTSLSSIGSVVLVAALAGCAPVRRPEFRQFFLPPSANTLKENAAPEPPVLETTVDLDSIPHEIPSLAPPRVGRGAFLAQEAESHYQAGRRQYQEGDLEGARREFDAAVDTLLGAPNGASSTPDLDRKLDELVTAIHRFDLAGLGSGETDEPAFEKPPLEDLPPLTFPVDPRMKNRVLEEVRATVSQLPLDAPDPVLSYIRYFSTERGRRILIYGLRRAGKYRPLIQRVLDEEGVPQELIFLAQAESGFLPRAVSRKRATGMWQFVQFRGREYGLNQSTYSDDRLDPEKATRAAARHLRDLYQHFGDWYLALAGYNCGPVAVDRAIERTGYADFWELKRRNVLPKETSNYVPIILAMTIMVKNAAEYGLENIDPDPPLAYDTIEVTAPTNLMLLADLTDCPVSQLRELNPALLKNVAPAGWLLHVPRGAAGSLKAAIETVPADRRANWRAHRAVSGEDMAAIAARYKVSTASLAAANQEIDGSPAAGDLVLIPVRLAQEQAAPARRTARTATARRGTSRTTRTTATATAARVRKAPGPAALRKTPAHKGGVEYAQSRHRSAPVKR
jgi:membrane-bound lytic murein transglycosylase D